MAGAPRRIVLTGCTRGLGRALVDRFAADGHQVHGCGRIDELLAELRLAWPAPHDFQNVDVADATQVSAWAARLLANGPPPDLLVNNAAVMNRQAPLWEISAAEFAAVMDVNVKGVANVIRAFVPSMVKAGRGVIVNLSSGWGRSVDANVAPYCASKWAIEGLSKALAEELPSGMAAVPLNPGIIDTDMLRQGWGEGASQYPAPSDWSRRAAPFILNLSGKDNGRSLTV